MASKIVNTKSVHFPYKVKLGLFTNSRSFLANQRARNAIVGAGNLLIKDIKLQSRDRFNQKFDPISFVQFRRVTACFRFCYTWSSAKK